MPRLPHPIVTDSDSAASKPETPAETRARLLHDQAVEARAALAARVNANPYRPPVEVRVETVQAEVTAANARAFPPVVDPKPAQSGLPPAARAGADLPMSNPPVHRAQIKPIPGKVDTEGFLARVRTMPAQPKLSNKTMTAVARAIVWFIGKASTPDQAVPGIAQASYTSIATAAQCCRTQAWRAIKAFRARGILDIFNVVVREDNDLFRDPNAYSLRGFTKAIPAAIEAVKDAATGAFDRVTEQVRRFAHVWDMRANRAGPRPTRPHPDPKSRRRAAPA